MVTTLRLKSGQTESAKEGEIMDDKAWELILARFDKIEKDLIEIRSENKVQTKMIGSLRITVATVSASVTLIVTYLKAKFFGG